MNRFYAVYAPYGYPLPETVRHKRHEAVAAFVAAYGLDWEAWRNAGYHAQKVEIRLLAREEATS